MDSWLGALSCALPFFERETHEYSRTNHTPQRPQNKCRTVLYLQVLTTLLNAAFLSGPLNLAIVVGALVVVVAVFGYNDNGDR